MRHAFICAAIMSFIYAAGRANTQRNMEYAQRLKELTRALEIERCRMDLYEHLAEDAMIEIGDLKLTLAWHDKLNISTLRANRIIDQIKNL